MTCRREMVPRTTKHNTASYVVGFSAGAISLVLLLTRGMEPRMGLACVFLLVACIVDTTTARIPNWLTVGLVVLGFGSNVWTLGWAGFGQSALGAVTGLSVFLVPYLMGGMGGGDVKAMAALGALVGTGAILQVALYTALAGGVLSIVQCACGPGGAERVGRWRIALVAFAATGSVECLRFGGDRAPLRFPYAAAIAFGFFVYVQMGSAW